MNGQRKSVTLAFPPTSRAGAYALRKQWGDAGVWTLVIAVKQRETDFANALVEIVAVGSVGKVQVPTRTGERDMPFPRVVSAQEIDIALRARARVVIGQRLSR